VGEAAVHKLSSRRVLHHVLPLGVLPQRPQIVWDPPVTKTKLNYVG
jgi:hypothetical protein